MSAVVRTVIIVVGVLFMLGGLSVIVAVPSLTTFTGLQLVAIGAFLVVVVAIERSRYRSATAERTNAPAGPGGGEPSGAALESRFRPTAEVFIDPTSSQRMRVVIDPASVGTSPRADATLEPVEVEVKFGVAFPEHVRHLLESPDAAALAGFAPVGPLRVIVVVDRYMDTAVIGGSLYLAGMRARLRIAAADVVLTVKRRGTLESGITTRTEIEAPATAVLDPLSWPASNAQSLLLEAAGAEPLVEIAALRQRRLVRDFARSSTRVELSLDEMDALDGEAVVDRRVELEAELKAGPVEALEDLAAALREIEGVGPPQGSKLDFALGSRAAAARSGASER